MNKGIFSVIFWLFTVWFCWQIIQLTRHGDRFFKKVAKEYPDYYASIGTPSYKSFALIQNHRARVFVNSLIRKGIPRDFPDDEDLRGIAKDIRYRAARMYIAFAIFFASAVILGPRK